jgi:hypothetical protein
MTIKTSLHDVQGARTPCVDPGAAPPPPSVGARGSGQKVVLLRRRGAPAPAAQAAGSDVLLDMQAPIDNLRSIKGDLELYYWERPGQGEQQERERYQVSLWIRQVSERTATLEGILLHMGRPSIVLTSAGAGECEALRSASNLLGRWIRDDEPFEQVRQTVAAILNASDVICLAAAGGRAEPRVGRPPTT